MQLAIIPAKRRSFKWEQEGIYDTRNAAMDEEKKRGFSTFAGSGTLAVTSLRCTQHTKCFKGDGAMLRVVSTTQSKSRTGPVMFRFFYDRRSPVLAACIEAPLPYVVWSVYEQRAACW